MKDKEQVMAMSDRKHFDKSKGYSAKQALLPSGIW
jgi:hypothetical protein